jgi:large conductance mechanosensitive channel
MLKEFKTFIMRGNVVDLAVAVIIGAAFGAIVNSLVADVITPLLLKPTMESLGVEKLEGLAWNGVLYGKFLATVINFIVVGFVIFLYWNPTEKLAVVNASIFIDSSFIAGFTLIIVTPVFLSLVYT